MTIPQPKTRDDLIALLSITDPDELQALYDAAYAVKAAGVGRVVYYRGLVEFSNYCIKDCKYCGIRKSNDEVERFDTPREDILAMARWAWENRYGSLTLQSGERQDEEFIDYVEGLVRDIKALSHGELGLTLCVGEQTEETYRRWFDAGAHRYLLRIETSNPDLYATLHPQDGHHRWQVRKDCLDSLRRIGYQVGTGDMIGLPGQTLGDLADDILFYRDMDIDMIGMGPYVVHHNTPVGKDVMAAGMDSAEEKKRRLELGLKMIAVTRLFLPDVNIAATTALQALHPLQSGERQDEEFIDYVEGLVRDIKALSHGELGLTLCVGEQTEETYRRWFDAGAHRYLLRIETSNPDLYATLHPQDGHHRWQVRKDCLDSLRRIGYQVGTGDMIGLPGQTLGDLADDILFYRDMDIDMIGMGPYVVHHNTPVGKDVMAAGMDSAEEKKRRLELGLKMIAVTRLFLPDVNIAATTALQALHPLGRELGLKAGANVLMPIVTVPKYRPQYLLYDNKPCVDEVPDQCKNCLSARVASVGDTIGLGQWGDSPHFFHKK